MNAPPHPAARVMWLLNHTTLRQFEAQRLLRAGVAALFTPKQFPYDEGNLSASVSHAFDSTLSLTPAELAVLNAQDWYGNASEQAWQIGNQHFDMLFTGFFPAQLLDVCRHFRGAIVVRAFGPGGSLSYSALIRRHGGTALQAALLQCQQRLWFAMAYAHLAANEQDLVARRSVYLPVGLKQESAPAPWQGQEHRLLFICPRIGSSAYFRQVFQDFQTQFHDLPYCVGGAQPVAVDNPHVLGFLDDQAYARLMQQCRLMYYHAREPNHVHYHPFEAVRAGMPLLFMGGGMLDRLGGRGLPGRCSSTAQARHKAQRMLAGDWDLVERIRASQRVLLHAMQAESCAPAWDQGFARIREGLQAWRAQQSARPPPLRRLRIAVILPVAYRGGSLRGALALAEALHLGSRQCGEDADIVFLHLDDTSSYPVDAFAALASGIARRPFRWKLLGPAQARRCMRYAGFAGWEPEADAYMAPDDGMQQLLDCDAWLIVSDRLSHPLLPLRPVVLQVYDYLQRYLPLQPEGADRPYLQLARSAARVLVTTEFTRQDALQYAGVAPGRVRKLPMLAPDFPIERTQAGQSSDQPPYFVWTTNAGPHKNHVHAAMALRIYYQELQGQCDCWVCGVDTEALLSGKLAHQRAMASVFARHRWLRQRVHWMGELPEASYRQLVQQAHFLWHAARIDNGTFAVIEAACLGVPALSSDYPAMREIDAQFSLQLAWADPDSPRHMAEQLKQMERQASQRRSLLPSVQQLQAQSIASHARAYWQELRTCL